MIYVFKTSVETKEDVVTIAPRLDELLIRSRWNFDLDDCDRILRIDSPDEVTEGVRNLLIQRGFECEELF